ncbi:hypothetical protein [Virgibacillus sp. DJP39]|uniref:hypothetical protein n=1 Tax=Virgibacillus sp. DJP39 TaxID=3409790 RepID=UPI003BB53EDA
MRNLLTTYYGIQTEGTCFLDGAEGYIGNEYIYFIIPAVNNETIHAEQLSLAYYLFENGLNNIAVPVQNINGDWVTLFMGEEYIVTKTQHINQQNRLEHGQYLANFHRIGAGYPYEPQDFSSYGEWKQLWINKLTAFEQKVDQDELMYQSSYHRKLSDLFPYIIGISENAIQYLQETEFDNRFHDGDRGAITFRRYTNQCSRDIIWHGNFIVDHPVRDLAEYIRYCVLYQGDSGRDNVVKFLHVYQREQPLSVFSWRLLYARLLYPVHFFDLMEKGFTSTSHDSLLTSLNDLQQKQLRYEKFMGEFFQLVEVNHDIWKIPVVDWL